MANGPKVLLMGFRFNPVKKKRALPNNTKSVSRKVHCVAIKVDGEFMAQITMNRQEVLVIPFTKNSFNLKGKTKVFSVKKDKRTKTPIMFIRTEQEAIVSPGIPTQYKVLEENYVYYGKIIKEKGKYYFDVVDCVDRINRCEHLIGINPEIEKEIRLYK